MNNSSAWTAWKASEIILFLVCKRDFLESLYKIQSRQRLQGSERKQPPPKAFASAFVRSWTVGHSYLSIPQICWAAGPPPQSAGRETLTRWESTKSHNTLPDWGREMSVSLREVQGERVHMSQEWQLQSAEESYPWGRKGRRVVHPGTGRPRWWLWPERWRRRRRPRCRPDTWSDRCRRTEWQTPGSPGLTPGEGDTGSVSWTQGKNNNTTTQQQLGGCLEACGCLTCLSLRLSRVRSQEEEKTMSWPGERAYTNLRPLDWASVMRFRSWPEEGERAGRGGVQGVAGTRCDASQAKNFHICPRPDQLFWMQSRVTRVWWEELLTCGASSYFWLCFYLWVTSRIHLVHFVST